MKILKKYKAFTLIELLIVIAIIGIMSSVIFVSLNSNKSSARLQTAQREVTSAIKLAQTYALQGKSQSGVTPCGYGVIFDNNRTTYHIFYNPVGTGSYHNCEERNADRTGRGWTNAAQIQSGNAEDYSFKNGVTLSSNFNDAQVYFTVPHAEMFDRKGDSYVSQTLMLDFSGITKTIIVNSGGYVTEN